MAVNGIITSGFGTRRGAVLVSVLFLPVHWSESNWTHFTQYSHPTVQKTAHIPFWSKWDYQTDWTKFVIQTAFLVMLAAVIANIRKPRKNRATE
jgi:hypothetical protein